MYKIYTDGAYSSKRDQGGLGIIIVKDDNLSIQRYNKSFYKTTNNRMELSAVIIALKAIKKPIDKLCIYTDSMYVIGCATKGWQRKKNQDLWKLFDEVFKKASFLCSDGIEFIHVKGHNGNKWNEEADKLAVMASNQ